jgi:ABC-2 type transport system permease protein
MAAEISAILVIAHRDFVKLLRDRVRILADFTLPLTLVLLLGPTLQAGFGEPGGVDITTFVFTGVLAQSVWQSASLGVISLIADREADFSQEVFVSPISRYSIVAGKIIGESLVALPQALAVLALGLLLGIPLSVITVVALLPMVLAMAIYGGAFGILILSNISSQRTASQIFPFVMLPQFFLAGVFTPIHALPPVLAALSAISPMRWAVEAVRHVYYGTQPEMVEPVLSPVPVVVTVIAVSFVAFIVAGTALFVRAEQNR